MNDNTEQDFRRINAEDVATCFVSDSAIEVIGDFRPETTPKHVLFDFDGTLSLIREGWAEVMIPMMAELLQATGTEEPTESLDAQCRDFVTELTGKQTIYQMIRFAAEVQRRGGHALDPLDYKNMYHDRLMEQIESRRTQLRESTDGPGRYIVPGSHRLLSLLAERGCELYLASGTDEEYVREEVELLGLAEFFGARVYGARDDYQSFSKAQVIDRILSSEGINGDTLLGFGDGFVEIQNVRDAGGTAIAVASDESQRSGKPDAWKRDRLIAAGAHAIVPDFSQADRIVAWLFQEAE